MKTLLFQGNDVRLVHRTGARGQVVVEYLQRGQPAGRFATVWPHEIRNHPEGFAGLKRAIAALPDSRAAAVAAADPSPPHQEPRPRAFLHAHHAAGHDRED